MSIRRKLKTNPLQPAIRWAESGGSRVILARLKQDLRRDEGLRLKAYRDSLGFITIGYGHQSSVLTLGSKISLSQAEQLLQGDIDQALVLAKSYLEPVDFDRLGDVRQRAVVNMAFNLGNRLFEFKKMKQAILLDKWERAARCALDSLWAKQVGERSLRIAAMLEKGQ